MRVFSIFCTYISEGVFKPHFKKSSEEVQTICTIPQDGSHSSSSGCGNTPKAAARHIWAERRVYAAVRGLTQAAGTAAGQGNLRQGQAAMCWGPLCRSRRRWSSPHCASGSESEKNRKKVRRTSTPDTKRRRKANEKTNTQYPAAVLHGADHGADHAADNGLCCG